MRTESSEPLGDDVTALAPLATLATLIWRRARDGGMCSSGELGPLSVLDMYAPGAPLVLI